MGFINNRIAIRVPIANGLPDLTGFPGLVLTGQTDLAVSICTNPPADTNNPPDGYAAKYQSATYPWLTYEYQSLSKPTRVPIFSVVLLRPDGTSWLFVCADEITRIPLNSGLFAQLMSKVATVTYALSDVERAAVIA